MSDNDSRDHERPARAAASLPDDTPDGRRAWVELSGFQRDCLEAVARRARNGYPCYASGIARTLERRYPTVSRARVKPSLRILADRGFITSRDASPATSPPTASPTPAARCSSSAPNASPSSAISSANPPRERHPPTEYP